MKSTILLLAFAIIAFSSCTTAYKTGQTPDDVYFSPAPQQEEYVQMDRDDDRRYNNDQAYYDDRYLRMKVRNRVQWSDLDDYYYFDNRYSYSSYRNWNNPWSPIGYWNTYYNPYCYSCCVSGYTKNNIATGKPRIFNLNSYNTVSLTNNNYSNPKVTTNGFRLFDANRNSGRSNNNNSGSFLRNIFNGNNNNSSSSGNKSSGSSGGSSGGSSSGGGSAPVRRF